MIGVLLLVFEGSSALAELPQVEIVKMPAQIGTCYFDPKRPPHDRRQLTEPEAAVCAGDFLSGTSVGAQAMQIETTHAKARSTGSL